MTLREYMKDHLVFLDGGMGTMLQRAGLNTAGVLSENWNLTHPEIVRDIHRQYYDAGSNIVYTNTFGVNGLKYSESEVNRFVDIAVDNVKAAAALSSAPQEKFTALDIGPLGRLLRPLGDLDFEEAVKAFSLVIRAGVRSGVDLIVIETMNDSYETKAAVIAAKENADLPIFVTNAYNDDGKLMTGADPEAMVAMLEGLRVDAVGINCSYGPAQLMPVVLKYLDAASLPVIFKPNAGLPRTENGETVFDIDAAAFAEIVGSAVQKGVRIIGGCCGTTPEHIRALGQQTTDIAPIPCVNRRRTVVSSYTHSLVFDRDPVIIGERINPTGKKRLKAALKAGDGDYILAEGIRQQTEGAHALDVNVGLPEIDEKAVLDKAVTALQAVVDLPLQIDSADPEALEPAVRHYNGKPLINSVNGKKESMESVFPIAAKYGGVMVALTLDEQGIPETVEGRVAVAKKIIDRAATYGIDKKDLIFDPLTMAVSAVPKGAEVTLGALKAIRENLGCAAVLGVSNISFGLPERDTVNSAFLMSALEHGLNAAIMNPGSTAMKKTIFGYRLLHGLDRNCLDYIAFAEGLKPETIQSVTPSVKETGSKDDLKQAVIRGLRDRAAQLTAVLLKTADPMAIINEQIIPALDQVGQGFEKKTVFLPQLLMSAEAASAAFEMVKSAFSGSEDNKCDFVLATVQGDIHDIGKNIVRLLLENYGFTVHDLGRDVPPTAVLEAVKKYHAPIAGLSALMTTTLPAMAETVALIKQQAPWCQVIVGGAVLTGETADRIGADHYAKDAMEVVRCSEAIDARIDRKKEM